MMSDDDNDGQMIFGDLVGLKLPDICLTGEEKPQKNLTQETCPNCGSNPGLLRDRCACYHLAHSGGRISLWIVVVAKGSCILQVNFYSFQQRHVVNTSVSVNNLKHVVIIINFLFWSVNFFRRTMHSKSPVMNLAEPSWNTFGEQVSSSMQQSVVTGI